MITLMEACTAATRRKEAALAVEADDDRLLAAEVGDDCFRRLFSDFDLDIEEAKEASDSVATLMALTAATSGHFHLTFAGAWLDGLLVGLLLGKMRAEEEE